MNFPLETLPHRWVNVAFLFFAILSLRSLIRLARGRRVDSDSYAHTRGSPLVIAFASFVATAVIANYMFLRFHTLEVQSNRIELTYYWPRPKYALDRRAFQRAEFVPGAAGVANLYLYAQNAPIKSVPFNANGIQTNHIQIALNSWRLQ